MCSANSSRVKFIMTKNLTLTVILCVLAIISTPSLSQEIGEDDASSWDISWEREFSFTEPSQAPTGDLASLLGSAFSQPGVIIPGLQTMSALRIIGDAINTNTTKEALAELCTNFGPLLYYIVGDRVQSICQPILKAVQKNTDLDGVSETCVAAWDEDTTDADMDEDLTVEMDGGEGIEEDFVDDSVTSRRRKRRAVSRSKTPYQEELPATDEWIDDEWLVTELPPNDYPSSKVSFHQALWKIVNWWMESDSQHSHWSWGGDKTPAPRYPWMENGDDDSHKDFMLGLFGMDKSHEKCEDLRYFIDEYGHQSVEELVKQRLDKLITEVAVLAPYLCGITDLTDDIEDDLSGLLDNIDFQWDVENSTGLPIDLDGIMDEFGEIVDNIDLGNIRFPWNRDNDDDIDTTEGPGIDAMETETMETEAMETEAPSRLGGFLSGGRRGKRAVLPWKRDGGEADAEDEDIGIPSTEDKDRHTKPDDNLWSHGQFGPLSGQQVASLFAYLSGFDSPAAMCHNFNSMDINQQYIYQLLINQTVGEMTDMLLGAIKELDECVVVLEAAESTPDEFNLYETLGYEDKFELCHDIVNAFNTSTDRDPPYTVLMKSQHDKPMESDPTGIDSHEALAIAGYVFDKSINEAVTTTCELLDHNGQLIDKERDLCNAWDESWSDNFIDSCQELFDVHVWDWIPSMPSWAEWFSQIFDKSFLEQFLADKMPTFLTHVFKLHELSPEGMCSVAASVVYNDSVTTQMLIDNMLDRGLRELARVSPALCYGNDDGMNDDDEWQEGTESPRTWQMGTESPIRARREGTKSPRTWQEGTESPRTPYDNINALNVLGAVMTHLGDYENVDSMCENITHIVDRENDKSEEFDEIIDQVKYHILIALEDIDVCMGILNAVESEIDLYNIHQFLGVTGNGEICQALVKGFQQKSTSDIDLSFLVRAGNMMEDSGMNLDGVSMEEIFNFAGMIYNANLLDVISTSCYTLKNETDDAICDILFNLPPQYFVAGCVEVVSTALDNHLGRGSFWQWEHLLPDWLESSALLKIPRWIQMLFSDNLSIVHLPELLNDLFSWGFLRGDGPRGWCDKFENALYERSFNFNAMLGRSFNSSYAFFALGAPAMCAMSDDDLQAFPGMMDKDTFQVLGDVFEYVSGYHICHDVILEASKDKKSWHRDDLERHIGNATNHTLHALHNVTFCTGLLTHILNEPDEAEDFANMFGFASNKELCHLVSDIFNSQIVNESIDISVFRGDFYNNSDDYEDKPWYFTTAFPPIEDDGKMKQELVKTEQELVSSFIEELLKLLAQLNSTKNMHELLNKTCDIFSQDGDIEMFLGPRSGEMCDIIWRNDTWFYDDYDDGMYDHKSLGKFCEAVYDRANDTFMNRPHWFIPEWLNDIYFPLFNWWSDFLDGEVFPVKGFFMMLKDLFGVGLTTTPVEKVCNEVASVLYDGNVTVEKVVDEALDKVLREMAAISPWLCYGRASEFDMEDWDADYEWDLGTDSPLPTDRSPHDHFVDPFDILGVVFAYLGDYDDSDALCEDITAIVANGRRHNYELDEAVYMMKNNLLFALEDNTTCVGVFEAVESKMHLQTLYQSAGVHNKEHICQIIVEGFTGYDTSYIDMSFFFNNDTSDEEWTDKEDGNPLGEIVQLLGHLYYADGDEYIMDTICHTMHHVSGGTFSVPLCSIISNLPPTYFVAGCVETISSVIDGIFDDSDPHDHPHIPHWLPSWLRPLMDIVKPIISWWNDGNTGEALVSFRDFVMFLKDMWNSGSDGFMLPYEKIIMLLKEMWTGGGDGILSQFNKILMLLTDMWNVGGNEILLKFEKFVMLIKDMWNGGGDDILFQFEKIFMLLKDLLNNDGDWMFPFQKIMRLLDLMNLDIASVPESVCNATASIIYRDDLMVDKLINEYLDKTLLGLAYATPWLCHGRGGDRDERQRRTEPPFATSLPWNTDRPYNDDDDDDDGFDPVDLLGAVFTYLGEYEDIDALCEDITLAVTEGNNTSIDEVNEIMERIKSNLMSAAQDFNTCVGIFDAVESKMSLDLIYQFAGSEVICEGLTEHLNNHSMTSTCGMIDMVTGGFFGNMSVCDVKEMLPPEYFVAGCVESITSFDAIDNILSWLQLPNWIRSLKNIVTSVFSWWNHDDDNDGDGFFPIEAILTFLQDMFRFNLAEDVCNVTASIVYNEAITEITVKQLVDEALDESLLNLAYISPWLCYGRAHQTAGFGDWLQTTAEPFTTSMPWLIDGPHESFYSFDLLGDVFTYLGEYEDTDSLCSEIAYAVTESNMTNNDLGEIVERIKHNLLFITQNTDACTGLLNEVQNKIPEEMFYTLTGLSSSEEICDALVEGFSEQSSSGMFFNSSSLDKEFSSKEIMTFIGHVYHSSNIQSAMGTGCNALDQVTGGILQFENISMCDVLDNLPPEYFIVECQETIDTILEERLYLDIWDWVVSAWLEIYNSEWPEWLNPSQWIYDFYKSIFTSILDVDDILSWLQLPSWIKSLKDIVTSIFSWWNYDNDNDIDGFFPIEAILSFLQDMFRFNLAEDVCNVTASIVYNEAVREITVKQLVDKALKESLLNLAYISPWLCYGRAHETTGFGDWLHATATPFTTSLPWFNDGPSDDKSVYSFDLLGDVFTYLGEYEDTDALCAEITSAVTESNMTNDDLGGIVERIKHNLLFITQDIDACVGLLNEVEGKMPEGIIYTFAGLSSNEEVCGTLVEGFNDQSSSVMFFNSSSPDNEYSLKEIVTFIGHVYHSSNIQSAMGTGCNALDRVTEGLLQFENIYVCGVLDNLPPEYFIVGCEETIDTILEEHLYVDMFELVVAAWLELSNSELPAWLDPSHLIDHLHSSIVSWWLELSNSDLFSVDGILTLLRDVFGFHAMTITEDLCDATASILYSDDVPVAHMVDQALGEIIREVAYISPWLCYGRTNENPSWNNMTDIGEWILATAQPFTNANANLHYDDETPAEESFDPFDLIGVIFTYLGEYEDTDALCEDVTLLVAEEVFAPSEELDELLERIKTNLLLAAQDFNTCVGILDAVDSSVNLQNIYSNMGLTSTEHMCEVVVEAFTDAESQLDSADDVNPSIEIIKFLGKSYQANRLVDVVSNGCNTFNEVTGGAVPMCSLIANIPASFFVSGCTQAIKSGIQDIIATDWSMIRMPSWLSPSEWLNRISAHILSWLELESYWDIFSPEYLLKFLEGMFGFNVETAPENMCDATATILYGELISVEQRIDRIINEIHFQLAYMFPFLNDIEDRITIEQLVEKILNGTFHEIAQISPLNYLSEALDVGHFVNQLLNGTLRELGHRSPLQYIDNIVSVHQTVDRFLNQTIRELAHKLPLQYIEDIVSVEEYINQILNGTLRELKQHVSSLHNIAENFDVGEFIEQVLEDTLRELAGISPWLCYGNDTYDYGDWYETTIQPFTERPFPDYEFDPVNNLLGVIIARLGEYGNIDTLCEDITSIVLSDEHIHGNMDGLDAWIDRIKINLPLVATDPDTCAGILDEVESQIDMDFHVIRRLTGIPSNYEICQRLVLGLRELHIPYTSFFMIHNNSMHFFEWLTDSDMFMTEILNFFEHLYRAESLLDIIEIGCDTVSHATNGTFEMPICEFITRLPVPYFEMADQVLNATLRELPNMSALLHNGEMSVYQLIDEFLDQTLRELLHISPWVCYGDTSEVPSWNGTINDTKEWIQPKDRPSFEDGLDPLTLMGSVFAHLGEYDSSDAMCVDLTAVISADNLNHGHMTELDDRIDRFKTNLHFTVTEMTCNIWTSMMDAVEGEMNLQGIHGNRGLPSNEDMCRGLFNGSIQHSNLNMSSIMSMMHGSRPNDHRSNNTELGYYWSEISNLVQPFYRAETLVEIIGATCDTVNQATDGALEIPMCSVITSLPAPIFVEGCVVTLSSVLDEIFNLDDSGDDDDHDDWSPFYEWLYDTAFQMIGKHNLSEISPQIPRTLLLLHDVFGLDISSSHGFCNVTTSLYYNDTITVAHRIDQVLNHTIWELAELTPWLCYGRTDEHLSWEEDIDDMNDWKEETIPVRRKRSVTTPRPHGIDRESFEDDIDIELSSGLDPFNLLGAVFSYLGNYENSDVLCENITRLVSNHSYEHQFMLNETVHRIKQNLVLATKDIHVCAGLLNALESELNLGIIRQLLQFSSNEHICEVFIEEFNRDTSSMESDYEVDLNPLVQISQFAGHLYHAKSLQNATTVACDTLHNSNTNRSISMLDFHVCDIVPDLPRENFYAVCVVIIDPFIEAIANETRPVVFPSPEPSATPGSEETDEDWELCFTCIEDTFHEIIRLMDIRFGLSDISNPYAICDASVELITTEHAQLVDFIYAASESLVYTAMKEYSSAICTTADVDDEAQSDLLTSIVTITETLLTHLPEQHSRDSICQHLDNDELLRNVSSLITSSAFSMITDSTTCIQLLDVVVPFLPADINFMNITGFSSHQGFCEHIVTSFEGGSNIDSPTIEPDTIASALQTNTGAILPTLLVQSAIPFIGSMYSTQNTIMDTAGVLCEQYGSLLYAIPANMTLNVSLAGMCEAVGVGDLYNISVTCRHLLVPLFNDQDAPHPVSLRDLDVAREFLKVLLPLVNYPVWEEYNTVCPATEAIINSEFGPGTLIDEMLQHWMLLGIEITAEICTDWGAVYEYNKPENYTDMPAIAYAYNQQLNGTWLAAATFFGYENAAALCTAVTGALENRNQDAVQDLADVLLERMYIMTSDVTACTEGLTSVVQMLYAQGLDFNGNNPIYLTTGYWSAQAFCIEFISIGNGEDSDEETECLGILDCADVCNGGTTYACDGICGGSSTRDCAGICNGDAIYNSCDYCVSGTTGRASTFGQDRCGICWSSPDYRITWDCNNVCNGTAFYDDCSECVGGDTGKSSNSSNGRIDCRGVCDGGWLEDACGYCNPWSSDDDGDPQTESLYQDCSGECFLPGSSSQAYENVCGICVGGSTGLGDDNGINACGQCSSDPNADESSCAGCDGVANSGLINDACGVCNGTGTTCFGVAWVVPDLTQENVDVTFEAYGAGFTVGSTFSCIFTSDDGDETETDATWQSLYVLTCDANLPQGSYTVSISKDGAVGTEVQASVSVLGSVTLSSMSPVEVTLDDASSDVTITVTAETSGAFADIGTDKAYAIVEGEYFSNGQLVYEGTFGTDDTTMVFSVGMPLFSAQFTVWPSLDGVNALPTPDNAGFTLTYRTPAPNINSIAFAPSGASLIVQLDSGVDYSEFSSCDDVFEDTSLLGNNAQCIWRGTTTLYIVIGTGDNLIHIGDPLTFKQDTVYAFNQEYSYSSTSSEEVQAPLNAVEVSAIITGTEKITSCGIVRLSGRLSKGGAGRSMTYTWSVDSDVASDSSINALQDVLDDISAPDVTLDGTLLSDADTLYTFTVTVENFLGESDTSSLEVARSGIATPEVAIVTKGVDISNAFVSESFDLIATVTFYSDCVAAGETIFSWSVDNDDVILNLKTLNTRKLHIDENSLPGGANITFSADVYKSSDPDKVVTQTITVSTVYTELVPVIRGGNELTIGRDSGYVSIDGSASFDPDLVAEDMAYEWRCEQVTDNTACWSFKEGEAGATFPNDTSAAKSVLVYDALSMEADKTYLFTLVVSKGSRSAESEVSVLALNGDPPRVVIVPVEGKVKSDKSLSISATIYHKTALQTISWETVDTDAGYGFLDLTSDDNLESAIATHAIDGSESSINFLNIKAGKLTAGSTYILQLNVTTNDGLYGLAKMEVSVLADVTSCTFSLDGLSQYEELETINYVIENCAADESAYPLTYQIFVTRDDEGTLEAVTERQSEPSSNGVGKPARAGTSNNTFVVEVCDKYISCAQVSLTVDVNVKESFSDEEVDALVEDLVTQEKYKLNYLPALVNYNVITQKVGEINSTTDGSRRRRKRAVTADETSTTAAEQLDLMEDIIDTSVLDTSTAQLQIDQLQFMVVSDLTLADQSRMLDIMETLVGVYEDDVDEAISTESAEIILGLSGSIRSGLDSSYNADMITKISAIESSLTNSQVSGLSLGGDAVETVSEYSTSSVQRAIPSGTFTSKTSGSNAASVDFGSDISSLYGANWDCSSGSCSGVTIQFEQFESDVDYLSVSADDQQNRAGDILSISLLDPDSGDELSISDLTSPITITMTVTIAQDDKDYECRFWNDTNSEWSSDGLSTNVISDTEIDCESSHLSYFTIMAVDQPSTVANTASTTIIIEATTSSETTDTGEVAPSNNGDDSTVIIIVVVVVVVVLLIIVVIGGVYFVKVKTSHKRVAASPEPEDPRTYSRPSSPAPLQTSREETIPVTGESVSNMTPTAILTPPGQLADDTDYMTVVNETTDIEAPAVYLPPPMPNQQQKQEQQQQHTEQQEQQKQDGTMDVMSVKSLNSVNSVPTASVTDVSKTGVAEVPTIDVTDSPSDNDVQSDTEVPTTDSVTEVPATDDTGVSNTNVTSISVSDAPNDDIPSTSVTDPTSDAGVSTTSAIDVPDTSITEID